MIYILQTAFPTIILHFQFSIKYKTAVYSTVTDFARFFGLSGSIPLLIDV
jgi:hypothetical protein